MMILNRKLIILLFFSAFSLEVFAEETDVYASIRDHLQTCFACHGENGTGNDQQPLTPILAGQESYYLYVQLKDFKSGLRKNPIMEPLVAGFEKEQMKLMGRFFSQQEWPASTYEASPEQIAEGQSGVTAGQCLACHLDGFEGESRVPKLAGQKVEYLKKTMLDMKTKARNNDASVSAIFSSFPDETIDALSHYLAGIK